MIPIRERVARFVGYKGDHLTDANKFVHLAGKLSLPDSQTFFSELEKKRAFARTYQIITEVATIAGLGALAQDRVDIFFPCLLLSILGQSQSGAISTKNDSLLQAHLETIQARLKRSKLGEVGDMAVDAVGNLILDTPEERRLSLRPPEILTNFALESLAVIASSPEKALPIVTLTAALGFLLAQNFWSDKVFRRINERFIDVKRRYKDTPSQAKAELDQVVESKARATRPLNGLTIALNGLIYWAASGKVISGGLLASVIAQIKSGFSSLTTRVMEVSKATADNRNFAAVHPNLVELLQSVISTQADFDRHKSQDHYLPPDEILEKIRPRLEIDFKQLRQGLLVDISLKKVRGSKGRERKNVSALIPLDGGIVCLSGPNGSGKSSFVEAFIHGFDNHNGVIALLSRGRQDQWQILDVHAIPVQELRSIFLQWGPEDFENSSGSFLANTGFSSAEEAVSYLLKIRDLWEVINITGIDEKVGEDFGIRKKLSEGERRMLQIISAIKKGIDDQVKFVFLDEPFATLSREATAVLTTYMKRISRETGIKFFIQTQERVTGGGSMGVVLDFSQDIISLHDHSRLNSVDLPLDNPFGVNKRVG